MKVRIGGYWQKPLYIVNDLRNLYLQFNRDDMYYCVSECEKIGNIYENPELLEVKE